MTTPINSSNQEASSKCKVCGLASTLRCSNCSQVVYCNRDHQKVDWAKHKGDCHPFKVQNDDKLGRYLVATRNIRPNEVVLKEKPIIQGPSQMTEPVCLVCLQALAQDRCVKCDDCGWPLCSEKCRNIRHESDHRFECRMTKEKGGGKVSISNFISPHPMYQPVLAMRSMMIREMEPTRWQKFISLESLCSLRKETEQYKLDRDGIAKFILRFYKPQAEWTEEEILKGVGVTQINGHEVPITEPPNISVYWKASLVEHSCRPNLSKSFTEDGEIVLWARFEIPKGSHLTICYTDALWGTESRRHHLKATKLFDCSCERCLDPTEFGTFFSALRCAPFLTDSRKCSGYLLPKAVKEGKTNQWTCNECQAEVPDKQVSELIDRAGRDLQVMRGSAVNCERYLKMYSAMFSQNHFNICEMKGVLAQRIGGDSPQHLRTISKDQLIRKINLYREILKVYQTIAPVENRHIGAIRFDLHASLAECARRNINREESLEESLLNAAECVKMLAHEPMILPEGQICQQAKLNLSALQETLLRM